MVRSGERQGREAGLGSKASVASYHLCGLGCHLGKQRLPPAGCCKDKGAQSRHTKGAQ